MKELIVVTYKLPTDDWTKKMYGHDVEHIYDCQAFWDNELSGPEIKKLKRKYSEVDSFVCSFAAYNDWIDNEAAYENFVRTGVCPLKPVTEELTLETDRKTVRINLVLEMTREDPDSGFEYSLDVDDVGQIVLTPKCEQVSFTSISRTTELFVAETTVDNNKKTFGLELTADMISEDGNFEWFVDIDEIGQAVITPEQETTSFLTISVEDSLNLVTESADTIDVEDAIVAEGSDKEQEIVESCCQDNTDTEFNNEEIDMKFIQESNKQRDFDWNDDLYAVIKDDGTYAGVPCRSYDEASQLAYHPGSKIFKLILEDDEKEVPLQEDVSNIDSQDIVSKVMRGDIPIYRGEGTPTEKMIHLPELDNCQGSVCFEYFYDEDSYSVVSYEKSSRSQE